MGQAHLQAGGGIRTEVLRVETEKSAKPDGASALETLRRFGSEMAPLPRVLCVFAHPDDETLALGGRLHRMSTSRLLTVTNGAPKDGVDARHHGFLSVEAYGRARRVELLAALHIAHHGPKFAPAFPLEIADQEVSLHLKEVTRAVLAEVESFAPEVVMTHAYEGGHPDHDGCAFAVHAAMRWMAKAKGRRVPLIVEAPFYHAGNDGSIVTGSFLHKTATEPVVNLVLTAAEQRRKQAMLASFVSQQQTLTQFGVEREMFREAPPYDFSQKPHTGPLFYEGFPWGMRGERLCALALAASQDLCGNDDLARVNERGAKTT